MVWSLDIFQAIFKYGWKGSWPDNFRATKDQINLIENVILTMENLSFSELEKIQKQSEKSEIWVEVWENDGQIQLIEHTKYSIVKGIISNFRQGQEMQQKTKQSKK